MSWETLARWPSINPALLAFPFSLDWKSQWRLQAADKHSKFKTVLCFGCGIALTWWKSEDLMLNYLDLSHLSRLKNYIRSQSSYLGLLCQQMTRFLLHRKTGDTYIFWGLITTQPGCTPQQHMKYAAHVSFSTGTSLAVLVSSGLSRR